MVLDCGRRAVYDEGQGAILFDIEGRKGRMR
jgi:hypothetical protein